MKKLLLPTLFFVLIWSCKDFLEEHTKTNEGVTKDNLVLVIKNIPGLSKFYEYLILSGWDKELASSKNYTVWAPDNEAMNRVDAAVLTDSAKLRKFIANHITFARYSFYSKEKTMKVKVYSGKNHTIDNQNGRIEDASLIQPYDIMASNGILHVIDKALTLKPNLWDIIETTNLCPKQASFINSLTKMVFDPSIATQIGVNPLTGKPVYDTITGMKWDNEFINRVRDLRNEDSLSTFILLTDDVFEQEFNRFRQYYDLKNDDSTTLLTSMEIVKDLVIPKQYSITDVPDTVISLFNVKVPFNRNAVVNTIETSNGTIYVLSSCNVRLQDKIQPVLIEGEAANKYITRSLVGMKGYTRQKELASGGYDFILDNHGANPGAIQYYVGNVCAVKYRYYWKAVNDFRYSYQYPNDTAKIRQRLEHVELLRMKNDEPVFDIPSPVSEIITVTDSMYTNAKEVLVGEYRFFNYKRNLWVQLTGTEKNKTIMLDYFKLVPVFE